MNPAESIAQRRGTRAKHSRRAGALIFCAFSVCLLAVGCGTGSDTTLRNPQPTFTTIDAPGAGTQAGQGTTVTGINASGDVVGSFQDSSGELNGFLRTPDGKFTVFNVPSGGIPASAPTLVTAVNASGVIAGNTVGSFGVPGQVPQPEGFIRATDGTITLVNMPISSETLITAMNDGGAVAGVYVDIAGPHVFIRRIDGTFASFEIPSALTVKIIIVRSIDSSGNIAGFFSDSNLVAHGFLRSSDGTITIIDAPNAGTVSPEGTVVTGANSTGAIVGSLSEPFGSTIAEHSFLRSAAGNYTVFDPPGAQNSSATAINDSGAIVGAYAGFNSVRHGYLRQPSGAFVILDDPDAAPDPGQPTGTILSLGTEPLDINASGAIVGEYSDANGVRHGFLWQ